LHGKSVIGLDVRLPAAVDAARTTAWVTLGPTTGVALKKVVVLVAVGTFVAQKKTTIAVFGVVT
jgi:hypothetical protein